MQADFTTFKPKCDEERPRQTLDEQSTKAGSSYLARNVKGLFGNSQHTLYSYQKSEHSAIERQNHRTHHSQAMANESQNTSHMNSKSYNLDESQSRLTQINQRMQTLRQKRTSRESSPLQQQIHEEMQGKDAMIESLKNEVGLLRNAIESHLDSQQLRAFLQQYQSCQQLNDVDLYTLAAYARNEINGQNESQINELRNQVQQTFERIEELEQQKNVYESEVEVTRKAISLQSLEMQELTSKNEYLLAENERLLKQYRSYKEKLEARLKVEEDQYRSIKCGKENVSPSHQSDHKYHELQVQFNSMMEKVRKDESSIKQLQEINFKLMMEVDGKASLENKSLHLERENGELQADLRDLRLKIEDQRNRAEKEREGKQSEFKQVFEELSRCRSELRILKDENQWLTNQRNALEEQYNKTCEMYNEVIQQRKSLLDEKEDLLAALDGMHQQHNEILEQQDSNSRAETVQLQSEVLHLQAEGQQLSSEINQLQAALRELDRNNQTQSQELDEQARLLKKYKKVVLQIHEVVGVNQQVLSSRYESLNEESILQNLQPAISNMVYLITQQQELWRVQEEERSQVIYDLQNQMADLCQQNDCLKQVNEKFESQYQTIKKELTKQSAVRKTLKKEYMHQRQVAEQCLADLKIKNEQNHQLQVKLQEHGSQRTQKSQPPADQFGDVISQFIAMLPHHIRASAEEYFKSPTQFTLNQLCTVLKEKPVAPDVWQLKQELTTKSGQLANLQIAYDELMVDYKRVSRESFGKMRILN